MSRHREIFETVQAEIADGRLAPGERLAGEVALAKRFGASRPTVARALNDLRAQGLIERRPGRGSFVVDRAATSGGSFGLIGSGLGHTEIIGPIAGELERSTLAHGYRLLLGEQRGEEAVMDLCRALRKRGVSGIFLAPVERVAMREVVNRRLADELAAGDIPVVLLDRDLLEFPERSRLDLVASDDLRAGVQLGRHLLERGCRSLAFVARPSPASTTDLRIAGCRSAVAAVGDATLSVLIGDPQDVDFSCGLARAYDGVICANDATAATLLTVLHQQGVRVPADLRVAGFDDVGTAEQLPVPLTSMRMSCRDIGIAAVHCMLERLRDRSLPPRQILLDPTLVARRSTAKRA